MREKTLYAHFAGSERSGESENKESAQFEAVKEERSGVEPVERRATGTDVRTLAPSRLEEAHQSLEAEASKQGQTDNERSLERSLDSTSKASIEGGSADSKEIQGKASADSKSSSESPSNSSDSGDSSKPSSTSTSSTSKVSETNNLAGSNNEDLEAGETTPLMGTDMTKLAPAEVLSPELWLLVWRCIRIGFCLALLGCLLATAWYGICFTSGWSSWSACSPLDAASQCGPGLRIRQRERWWGQCSGFSFVQNMPCDFGLCELDALTTSSICNAQARDSRLRELPHVFGSKWQLLEEYGMHVCCHPCNGVRVAGYVTCAHQEIGPASLISLDGCFSCFPVSPTSDYRCDNAEVCHKTFIASNGSKTGQELCCFALAKRTTTLNKHGKQAWVKGPDEVNFKRHPGTNAVLGRLRLDDFDSWPISPNERSCQNTCWENTFCYIYVYFSKDADNPRSRGRCLSWQLSIAERAGRASPKTWMLDPGVFSGLKLIPRLALTAVVAQTSSGPGSGSTGTFVLLICESPARCQDRKPLQLAANSCDKGVDCLATGQKASFVQSIVVPSSFSLHGVRVETFSDASWTLDSLQVTVDGEEGHFVGGATVDKLRPLFFSVGCVTQDNSPMVPGGTPCLTKCIHSERDFCYVDEEKTKWGYCSAACAVKQHEVKVKSEMTCAELNWPTRSEYNDDGAVCAASSDRPLKGCSGHVTWSSAQKTCKEVGARLCTQEELEADEAAGSGCGMDQNHIWSSSKCGINQFMAVAGATRYQAELAPRCTVADEPWQILAAFSCLNVLKHPQKSSSH